MSDNGLGDLLARHRAFWRRTGDGPLMSVSAYRPLEERGRLGAGGMRVGVS